MKQFVENMLVWERNLFFRLNGSDSALLDNIMHVVSTKEMWIPLYLFIAFLVFFRTRISQSALVFFSFILVAALADQFSSGLIKPIFERLRPGHHPDFREYVQLFTSTYMTESGEVGVRFHRGGGFAFISGHATNHTAFAVLLSLIFRNRWATLVSLFWAGLISYSRVYLGVHFVSDIIGGIIAGTLIAMAVYYLALVPLRKKLLKLDDSEKYQMYSAQHGKILWIGFAIYFAVALYATTTYLGSF
ncbi:MAG: phosphatase PAP2 family protein [Bacteroidales bacterium]|nr:phosphatase PAP2 family protein [Bacteroidales bacterium]